ncbi:hypothetical protein, partial [Streptococcus anginosus]|uniref:hypothetical protein n=1 Tax=Streptococcus anginosus TaxID=1328 RepID=UPI002ED88A8E
EKGKFGNRDGRGVGRSRKPDVKVLDLTESRIKYPGSKAFSFPLSILIGLLLSPVLGKLEPTLKVTDKDWESILGLWLRPWPYFTWRKYHWKR